MRGLKGGEGNDGSRLNKLIRSILHMSGYCKKYELGCRTMNKTSYITWKPNIFMKLLLICIFPYRSPTRDTMY